MRSCLCKKKDIRKFLDGIYVSSHGVKEVPSLNHFRFRVWGLGFLEILGLQDGGFRPPANTRPKPKASTSKLHSTLNPKPQSPNPKP